MSSGCGITICSVAISRLPGTEGASGRSPLPDRCARRVVTASPLNGISCCAAFIVRRRRPDMVGGVTGRRWGGLGGTAGIRTHRARIRSATCVGLLSPAYVQAPATTQCYQVDVDIIDRVAEAFLAAPI